MTSSSAESAPLPAAPVGRGQHLGMMGKFWQPGKVKTRLGATIGLEQSARVYRDFVEHLCRVLSKTADQRELVLAPAEQIPPAEQQLSTWGIIGWSVSAQADGDLGNRMKTWFQSKLITETKHQQPNSQQPGSAILIGGDCPLLTPDRIEAAFAELENNDGVLGPSIDGGYYLVGLRGPWKDNFSPLFDDMQWSQSDVLAETLSRAQQANLSLAMLPQDEDVDTIDELLKLADKIAGVIADQPDLARLEQSVKQAIAGAREKINREPNS